jgi:formylglycine-generating enzyme required for sulfatase activity
MSFTIFSFKYKILIFAVLIATHFGRLDAQKLFPFKLPDTGQNSSYTSTSGEDSDFNINTPSFTNNGDGTITDNTTGLMWQKTDGGEMTYENAITYCNNSTLGGNDDWRLPTSHELFSINNYGHVNPALDTSYFTKTQAEYWWTSDIRADDATKVWVVNAGGGIGAHPKTETISAGGTKLFHVRTVRNPFSTTFSLPHFSDIGNGTIKDNYTGLVWQKIQSPNMMTWEEALVFSKSFSLAGKTDWRLPNIKELQSLNDETLFKPSFNKNYFTNISSGNYWSSTTLIQNQTKAWDINVDYGIISYNDKTLKENVILVRGGFDASDLNFTEVCIPGGEFEMGDHFGFVDPSHPSDELPIHNVKVDSLYMSKTETTNEQYLAFLNSSLLSSLIEVRNNSVYFTGDTNILCYTNQYASYYSIGYDGKVFSIVDFRANHPLVGVMWYGAAAYCNWLSSQNGLQECYNPDTWDCDFTKDGYRLPTEAEWEYAGRGGQNNPYYNYPWGNDQDITKANWPESKDPYEGTTTNLYPYTTPVGFYDGSLHLKSEYNWPGSDTNYQTTNGANAYCLYDMAGNVWEFVNDWYGQNYYSISPYDNPTGPDSGFIMPDGKPYRGMRGGNWYNGYKTTSVNDGHSRVSNRNPSYYRGPQDPNHPWYHVGFRVARNYSTTTGIEETINNIPKAIHLYQNYPNPFNPVTTISFDLPTYGNVRIDVFNLIGQLVKTITNQYMSPGSYSVHFDASKLPSGIYFYRLNANNSIAVKKMIYSK